MAVAAALVVALAAGATASASLAAPAAAATDTGRPPVLGVGARDLTASFRLPLLHDGPGSALALEAGALQVGQRARALQLDGRSAGNAWAAADATLAAAERRLALPRPAATVLFAGSRASRLNALLRRPSTGAVRVVSARLAIDEPIVVGRAGVWLDLGDAELRAGAGGPTFLLRIERADNVTLEGGAFLAGRWGTLVAASRGATLRGGRYQGLQGGGVVLTDAPGAIVAGGRFRGIAGASILVHGDTTGAALLHNEIVGNGGSSNWHAGIVISDRRADVAATPLALLGPDRYGVVEQAIPTRQRPPRGTLLAYNRVALNGSSGIYSDGGVGSVMFQNVVEGNAKEGICLDNGSTANVVAMNLVRGNGKRWGKTDAELKLDFVGGLGRLADGSSPAKTPGISLDNAIYNVVYANQIDRNYGGGIKLVRTAYFNRIGLNVITDNNEGASARFHFFGIELGAAGADTPVADLDFAPSRGNLVFGNTIRGDHYAGIFFGAGSSENDSFDNTIFGASHWALEQVRTQANRSLDNLTNLPSRNIGNGLAPTLLDPGTPGPQGVRP